MELFKKISEILLVLLFSSGLYAQNNNCITSKSFPVKRGITLKLNNKYGDISIINSRNDSLSVCATVTIIQDNEEIRKKNISLINISIARISDTIQVATQYDKKFFSEPNREGRKSFSVDYLIRLPAYTDLFLVNEFGNISVDDISGTINARLSQGNFTAHRLEKGNIKPFNNIYVDHGKVDIDEINWMSLSVYNCPSVEIGKAQALIVTSVFSGIKLGEINSVIIDSKSDSYLIKSASNISSQSTYSTVDVGKFSGQSNFKSTYGSINIQEAAWGFSNIEISSSGSKIAVKTVQNIPFRTDITATDASVSFPSANYPDIKRTDSGNSTYILGTSGTEAEPKSIIRIRLTGGSLTFR
jgi:hypothetical protein